MTRLFRCSLILLLSVVSIANTSNYKSSNEVRLLDHNTGRESMSDQNQSAEFFTLVAIKHGRRIHYTNVGVKLHVSNASISRRFSVYPGQVQWTKIESISFLIPICHNLDDLKEALFKSGFEIELYSKIDPQKLMISVRNNAEIVYDALIDSNGRSRPISSASHNRHFSQDKYGD